MVSIASIVAFILIVVWIIAGGFATKASIIVGHYSDMDPDHLREAYNYLFWTAFVTWFLVGIVIVLVILAIFGVIALFSTGVGEAAEAGEFAESLQGASYRAPSFSIFTYTVLIIALGLVMLTGVLSIYSAIAIRSSVYFDQFQQQNNPDLDEAYRDCIISSCMCIGSAGVIILSTIAYTVSGIIKANRAKQYKKDEIETIRRLRIQSLKESAKNK